MSFWYYLWKISSSYILLFSKIKIFSWLFRSVIFRQSLISCKFHIVEAFDQIFHSAFQHFFYISVVHKVNYLSFEVVRRIAVSDKPLLTRALLYHRLTSPQTHDQNIPSPRLLRKPQLKWHCSNSELMLYLCHTLNTPSLQHRI